MDEAEFEEGYAGAMIVADWDADGADEVLVPRWGGPAYEDPELRDRRCDLLELDGTAKPTGLMGEQLGSDSVAWDFTGDGLPEIANDSRARGGMAYDKWFADKEAELAQALERELAPLRQRQQSIKDELEQLRTGGSDAGRVAELKAEDDIVFKQIDELRFGGQFSMSDEERRQGRGYFVRGDTSVINLAGEEIAKLNGRHCPGSQHLLGSFTAPGTHQLLLGPPYFSWEVEPTRNGGVHRVFSAGGSTAAKWDALASIDYLAAGDFDGDGITEISGRRLGYAPYAYPLAEIAVFDPNATPQVLILMRTDVETPGVWPAACLDLTGDGCAEIVLSCGLVLSPATGGSWQLDRPPFVRPAFLRNDTAPAIVLCDLDGLGQPEMWAVVQRTQLAAFSGEGSLVHYEDMGERILQLGVARDESGQAYLLVQLETHIMIWRVVPQVNLDSTMA